eukprot:1325758-Amphidinium_carterae.2
MVDLTAMRFGELSMKAVATSLIQGSVEHFCDGQRNEVHVPCGKKPIESTAENNCTASSRKAVTTTILSPSKPQIDSCC